MSKVWIYHNPRCSKSRQTLALLESGGHDVTVIEYLKHAPTAEQLDILLKAMDLEPLEVMRTGDPLFAELGLSTTDAKTRAEWLAVMHQNPALIQRPIVVCGKRAALGRPPEAALAVL